MKKTNVNWTVAAMMLAMLLSSLDQTIVSTAMPTIVSELKGMDIYSWVFTSYMLTVTTVMPIVGKLSDLYGRKMFFLLGLGLFMLGSALCGTADSMMQLVIYRGIQGLGAGALMPISFTIIFEIFPPEKRGKMQGIFGAVFGLSSVLGPTIGAYITEFISWQWIFYINLPLGVLSFIILVFSLVESKAQGYSPKVDFLGAGIMSVSIVTLLLALVFGGKEYPWSSWQVLGLFGISLLCLICFLFVERKASEPMLPLSLFKKRIVSVMTSISFMQGVVMMGAATYIPLFVQGVLGGSAANAGNILTPMMLSLVAGSMLGGFAMRKLTYRTTALASMAIMSIGSYFLCQINANTTALEITIYMIILGLGIGPLMPVTMTSVQGEVSPKQRGVATSSIAFFRSIGGTVGIAIMGAILTNQMTASLTEKLNGSTLGSGINLDSQLLLQPDTRANMPAPLLTALQGALTDAISYVFLFGFGAALVGFVLSFLLGKSKFTVPNKEIKSKPVTDGSL